MLKRTICGTKGYVHNAVVCKGSMTDLFSISHLIHRFCTYTAQKIQYVCTCFCTTLCGTLSMENRCPVPFGTEHLFLRTKDQSDRPVETEECRQWKRK